MVVTAEIRPALRGGHLVGTFPLQGQLFYDGRVVVRDRVVMARGGGAIYRRVTQLGKPVDLLVYQGRFVDGEGVYPSGCPVTEVTWKEVV